MLRADLPSAFKITLDGLNCDSLELYTLLAITFMANCVFLALLDVTFFNDVEHVVTSRASDPAQVEPRSRHLGIQQSTRDYATTSLDTLRTSILSPRLGQ